jgi:hypothetical protein
MKLKVIILSVIIILWQNSDVYAYTDINYTITVTDKSNRPVQYATVQVVRTKDGTLHYSDITNADGTLVIKKMEAEEYKLIISHINYALKEIVINVNESDNTPLQVQLEHKSELLEEQVINVNKKVFETSNDKLIINVKNSSIYSNQPGIIQLLSNIPGVINLNNLLTFRGNRKIQFAVNGRSIPLTGAAQYDYLQSISTQSIEKIELIEQPGSNYDMEGDVVINIITNQPKNIGWRSSVNTVLGTAYSYGSFLPSANNSISLQYGNEKLFWSLGYNYNYSEGYTNINERIDFNALKNFNQDIGFYDRGENVHNPTFQIQYSFNKKHEIGTAVNLNVKHKNTFLSNDMFVASDKIIDSTIATHSKENTQSLQKAIDFYYKWSIDSTQQIRYVIDLIGNKKDFFINSYNQFWVNNNHRDEIIAGKSLNDIFLVAQQLDYSKVISRDARLEAGAKYGYVNSKNNVQYRNETLNEFVNNNEFEYIERTFSAFVTYTQKYKTWNFNIGARYQSRSFETDNSHVQDVKKDFKNIFPNILISKTFASKNRISVNYFKRIVNPVYTNLSPYDYYVNPFTTLKGNEYLKPSITNRVDISYDFKSGVKIKSSNYKSKNFIATAQIQDKENFTQVLMSDNIGNLFSNSLEFSYPFMLNKYYMGYIGTGFEYQQYKEGPANKLGYRSNKKLIYYLFTQQEIQIPKLFNIELNGNIITPSPQAQFEINTICYLNIGITKSLWKGKLDAQLLLNDVFRSLKYDGWVYGNEWLSTYGNYKSSRQILIGLKYQLLNKGKLKTEKASWITNEEKSRLPK